MKRNAFMDNAKVLFIFLVVFGHMIQPFTTDSAEMNTLYLWIYTFHMPAFIMLSGFFAKGSGDKGYIMNLAKKLLVPYLIFQFIYSAYYFLIGNSSWQAGIFYPHWSLWFLFSLFSWHLLLIGFKKIPARHGIPIAIIVGIFIGYIGDVGHTFSLSRTFVFFPFFLIGYWLTEKQLMLVKRKGVKVASIVVMLALAVSLYYAPEINTGWLLASKSYIDLGMEEYGGIARLLVYITAAAMTVSVLAWVPKRNLGWITKLGTRTLYVYLLHGFFIQYFREYQLFEVNHVMDLIGMVVLSALIVIFLSSKPVLGISQPFIEGKASIVKKKLFHEKERQTNI
ncbi:acyltransferase family protein [Oceanobacillus halophilus]|uniref:Acyltransferase 3 domain-containing protein n=1 Tax=Oceanobacillus halophilus TaxID=930130 RepID=A0A494ZXP4_9BACI|nr:acyltransferase family protein [Oceanobacillus halophilus]RKQ31524.1 hypothetical protein D8M06_13610 [Oceanobacillus halophilus]